MRATLVDTPPRGDDWLFEVKWDGVRALAFIEGEAVHLTSRNGNPCERQYPELSVIHQNLAAKQVILDGEIAVLDEKGVSKFELIQPRIHNTDAAAIARMARTHPVAYFVFDLLYLDGYDLRKCDLAERKRVLARILTPSPMLRVSEHFAGAGEEMLEAARQNGLEGIIAKRAGSCYEAKRSRDWLKLKLVQQQEFVICGFTAGEREYFSSLALGVYDRGELVYVGNVGTGFDERMLADLWRRIEPLIQTKSPFAKTPRMLRAVTWIQPQLVCMVKFANWTQDQRLRAPVFLGLRPDTDPRDCTREKPEQPAPNLKFTNLDKVLYPDDGYTKRDVIQYYDSVADMILPHLKDRPLSLKRYPNGINEEFFFQKNTPTSYPSWLRTEIIDEINYVFADDRASLLYLANLGCIDHNPWMSRSGSLDNPDFVLIDLDPMECPFEMIVEAAVLVKNKLDAIGMEGYPKTTGGDGLHVYVPIEPVYSYDDSRTFAELIANMVIAERRELFTTPRAVAKRVKGKVYFDFLQNARSKTIAAPYVLRAYPGAPVATPLRWREVKKGLTPGQFHIRNAPARFERTGDLFAGVLDRRQRLEDGLARMEEIMGKR